MKSEEFEIQNEKVERGKRLITTGIIEVAYTLNLNPEQLRSFFYHVLHESMHSMKVSFDDTFKDAIETIHAKSPDEINKFNETTTERIRKKLKEAGLDDLREAYDEVINEIEKPKDDD